MDSSRVTRPIPGQPAGLKESAGLIPTNNHNGGATVPPQTATASGVAAASSASAAKEQQTSSIPSVPPVVSNFPGVINSPGAANPDIPGGSRKNSILLTDPQAKPTATAHPHFAENSTPHRSPSVWDIQQGTVRSSGSAASVPLPGGVAHPPAGGNGNGLGTAPATGTATSSLPSGPGNAGSNIQGPSTTGAGLYPIAPQSSQSSVASSRVSSRGNMFAPLGTTATTTQSSSIGPTSPSTTDSEQDPNGIATSGAVAPGAPGIAGSSGVLAGRATSKQPSDPRLPMDDGKIHILIGATGSLHIPSVKQTVAKLYSIYGDRASIQVIVTTAAENMLHHSDVASHVKVWHDKDEWETWRSRNDPVIHIELRRWADILVIAPLSANTLGKIAMGLCDNLLTNVVRAWNTQYPILVAPAMVSYAYNHPATRAHLRIIREEMKWIEILKPVEKVAGSTGGIGMGGMMAWNEIVDRIVQKLGGYPDEDDDEDKDEEAEQLAGNEEDDEEDDEDDDGNNDNNAAIIKNDLDHEQDTYEDATESLK